jgi:O-antigen ligase
MWLYATQYAIALSTCLVLTTYLYRSASGRFERTALAVGALLLTHNLLFTTARVAIVTAVVAAAWLVWSSWIRSFNRTGRWILSGLAGLSALVVLGLAAAYTYALVGEALSTLVTARGGGSSSARMYVYAETVSGWLERPLTGWATEQDIPGSAYPAGSHSYYLGVLFRHGLLGLAALVALYGTTLRSLRSSDGRWSLERTTGAAILIVLALNGFTEALDLDGVTLVYAWTSVGAMIRLAELERMEAPVHA